MSTPNLIERMEGDWGPDAVIDVVSVTDVNGDLVVDGALKLRLAQFVSGPYDAAGTWLLDAPLTHEVDGTWRWTPAEGDLVVGRWRMQLIHETVAIPSDGYGTLLVRPRLPGPPAVVGQVGAVEEPEEM